MKKRMWLCVALCALLVWTSVPSLAEDCFTIDVDTDRKSTRLNSSHPK